jgi:hypothetical protein
MKIYIAGPMRGYPDFNFPAFKDMAEWLRLKGYTVFNPAERDESVHGPDVGKSATGDLGEAVQKGFSLREALAADMKFIAEEADAIYMLAGWEASAGARAEWALAQALGLQTFYQAGIEDYEWKEVAHVIA